MRFHMRLAAAVALACLIAADASPALSQDGSGPSVRSDADRALTLDDVLSMETFGAALLSPDAGWIAYERRRPYDTAPRFDRSHRSGWALSDVWVAPVAGGASEPLLPAEPGAGVLLANWSPDGRRLLAHRLRGDTLEAGVIEMADRSVRWTGLTPDLVDGVSSAWVDPNRLIMTVRPNGDLPWLLRFDGTSQSEMSRRWTRTREGREPSRLRIESRNGLVTTDAVLPELELVSLDVRTGERRVLLRGAIRDFALSPKGRQIAVLTSAERVASDPTGPVVQSAVQTRSRLTLIDAETGRVTARPELDIAPHLLRWSPDETTVLVWAREDGQAWAGARLRGVRLDGEVEVFETGDLEPLEVGAHVDELRIVQADWLGDQVLFRARRPDSARRDWWRVGAGQPVVLTAPLKTPPSRLSALSEAEALAFADGRLWAIGGSDGLRPVTPEGATLSDGQTHTPMTPARLRANEAPYQDWAAARSSSGTVIVRGDGREGLASAARCDGVLTGQSILVTAVVARCLDQGVETLTLAAADGDRVLDRVNGAFSARRMAQAQAIAHRNIHGREVESYLYLPPGLSPAEVKGVIVLVYPGVVHDGRYVEATSLGILGPKPQVLATRGYAVLSAALPSEDEGDRASMIDDFVRGADLAVGAALSAAPGLPADRLAVLGHSFGGYTALAIATRPTRFRSVVAWAAPTDPATHWGELGAHARIWPEHTPTLVRGPGSVERGQALMGGPPWADVEGYAAASPFMMADRIRAPLLLIAADRDYVSLTQAERMLTAMHRQGKWARMVTYWGETHSNASPANVRDVYREIFDWLDRTLGAEAVKPPEGAAPMPEPSPRSPPSS